jgi:hypothetical protein
VADTTKTPVVPLLYGDDFAYTSNDVFEKAHNVITLLNKSSYPLSRNVNLIINISTYREYIDTVASYGKSYGVYRGDFFPYAQSLGSIYDYWIGYFTTRPNLKQQANNMMRLIR